MSSLVDYDQLLASFLTWAESEPGIRAAVMFGSRARTTHPADEWADLDLIVMAHDPKRYLADAGWVDRIGEAWLTFVEPSGDGRALERRVLFDGGRDVDFTFVPLSLIQQELQGQIAADLADMFHRGYRIVLDKDAVLPRWVAALPARQLPGPPTEAEFLNVVNDFWYHGVWSAKHLRRGELWWGKGGCDDHMKYLLRQMLEWHARATQGAAHDTWMRGRFLEEWADPRALGQLSGAFAHYDAADIWRALFVTMDLFRWLSIETARRWQYAYPQAGMERATELVHAIKEAR